MTVADRRDAGACQTTSSTNGRIRGQADHEPTAGAMDHGAGAAAGRAGPATRRTGSRSALGAHPSHFWLVLTVAGVNVALGLVASEVAARRDDDRTFLVSMALLASAGFLGLHALATQAS